MFVTGAHDNDHLKRLTPCAHIGGVMYKVSGKDLTANKGKISELIPSHDTTSINSRQFPIFARHLVHVLEARSVCLPGDLFAIMIQHTPRLVKIPWLEEGQCINHAHLRKGLIKQGLCAFLFISYSFHFHVHSLRFIF